MLSLVAWITKLHINLSSVFFNSVLGHYGVNELISNKGHMSLFYFSVMIYTSPNNALGFTGARQTLFMFSLYRSIRVALHFPTDGLNAVTCSLSCFHLIKCSVILYHHILFFSTLSPPLSLFSRSLLPAICCFHVSSKFFLPFANFKYSLRVLSTIAYKHLEIIESRWADKKGSGDCAQ